MELFFHKYAILFIEKIMLLMIHTIEDSGSSDA